MEAEETYLLSLHFSIDEVSTLKSLIRKLKDNPQTAGYVKKAFSKAERALIDDMHETLCCGPDEQPDQTITAHSQPHYTPEDE